MMIDLETMRQLFADYVASEGCSCCQDIPRHEEVATKIGEFLQVQKYSDDSGYDFRSYRSVRK